MFAKAGGGDPPPLTCRCKVICQQEHLKSVATDTPRTTCLSRSENHCKFKGCGSRTIALPPSLVSLLREVLQVVRCSRHTVDTQREGEKHLQSGRCRSVKAVFLSSATWTCPVWTPSTASNCTANRWRGMGRAPTSTRCMALESCLRVLPGVYKTVRGLK